MLLPLSIRELIKRLLELKFSKELKKKFHSLPDYAHTPGSIYAKLKADKKTLHAMRFYDEKGYPIIEIAYHNEPSINGGKGGNILHIHRYDGLNRKSAELMSLHPEIKLKYKKYLEEFGLYE